MQWNLRMKAAERGIWKSTELRRMFAGAGLEISAGKMSAWWTGTPNTVRLDELDAVGKVGATAEAVVERDDVVAALDEAGDHARAEEARASGHESPHSENAPDATAAATTPR